MGQYKWLPLFASPMHADSRRHVEVRLSDRNQCVKVLSDATEVPHHTGTLGMLHGDNLKKKIIRR